MPLFWAQSAIQAWIHTSFGGVWGGAATWAGRIIRRVRVTPSKTAWMHIQTRCRFASGTDFAGRINKVTRTYQTLPRPVMQMNHDCFGFRADKAAWRREGSGRKREDAFFAAESRQLGQQLACVSIKGFARARVL